MIQCMTDEPESDNAIKAPRKRKPRKAKSYALGQAIPLWLLAKAFNIERETLHKTYEKRSLVPLPGPGHKSFAIDAVEKLYPDLNLRKFLSDYYAALELAKSGDEEAAKRKSQTDHTDERAAEIASALADGGHARFIERIFSDVPKTEDLDPQDLEEIEMLKFEEANKRLDKLERIAETADEDGDLVALEDALAKFEDLSERIAQRWPPKPTS